MNLCVTVEGSPRVNALPSSSSSKCPEKSNKSNPVSLLPHLVSRRNYLKIFLDDFNVQVGKELSNFPQLAIKVFTVSHETMDPG